MGTSPVQREEEAEVQRIAAAIVQAKQTEPKVNRRSCESSSSLFEAPLRENRKRRRVDDGDQRRNDVVTLEQLRHSCRW